MSSHHGKFRNKYLNRKHRNEGEEEEENFLVVFGYSAKLHKTENIFSFDDDCQSTSSAVDALSFDENKHLIPWNGNEELKIDRYDVRLYLSCLDEFDKERKNLVNPEYNENDDEDSAEQLEEELCDEQRYADLYVDMRQKEIDEENKKLKRAEISYVYDEKQPSPLVDEEEEEDEPYVKPISLKLPVGIATPDSVRQNLLIERTALFVVERGPQMEVVIKAKQRHKAEQFGFLDFDHRLHPFYKYLCKQIREKKYIPELRQPTKIKKEPEPISSESDDSDSDGGYLHPLLCGGGDTKKTTNINSEASSEKGFIGPSKKPKQIIKNRSETSNCDLDLLIQQFHRTSNENSSSSLYSSLMKNLHSLIPGQSNKEEEQEKPVKNNEVNKNEIKLITPEPAKNQKKEILYETDESRINDYNLWHSEFYGRQSPYLPGPPPLPLVPAQDSAVESGIAVAAKYVAFQGSAAEQKLIEHNGDKVHFLSARSPYYTFYQSKVRQLQWQIYQQQQIQQKVVNNKNVHNQQQQLSSVTPKLLIKQIIKAATSTNLTPIKLPVGQQLGNNNKDDEDSSDFGDKKQQERREKARLFMERILNERMAEKHSSKRRTRRKLEEQPPPESLKDGEQQIILVEPPGIICTPILSDSICDDEQKSHLSKTIDSMIDVHIRKTFGNRNDDEGENSCNKNVSTPTRTGSDYAINNSSRDYEDTLKRKKEKRKRSNERKSRKRLTPSDNSDTEENEKRRRKKQKRNKERSDSRHRKHRHSSRHRSRSSSNSSSPKWSRKSRES